MRIGILGTRGIPNNYGGFEQLAEYLSVGLYNKGHEVTVYNSHTHPFQEKKWNGVDIVHCYDPENKIGTAGQFIYDLNCILDSRKRNFDVILQLGYTSSSIWFKLHPSKSTIITNMDGLEWKRSKYSQKVKYFLKYAEKLAVKNSDFLIADSIGIQDYLKQTYNKESAYIAYGTDVFTAPNIEVLNRYGLQADDYFIIIARPEPENNIATILEGYQLSRSTKKMIVVGGNHNAYADYLRKNFKSDKIQFVGSIYDIKILNNLRYYSSIYFHGHSVGGTNPSLLEAMSSAGFIVANNNPFNKHILGSDAMYFDSKDNVAQIINRYDVGEITTGGYKAANTYKAETLYNWASIIDKYDNVFLNSGK